MFYQAAITLPVSRLRALISLLDTIGAQAIEKGMADTDLLALRLSPDMFPLVKQIQITSDNAKWMASRLARREIPKHEDNETTLAELVARLEKTISYLETFSQWDFDNAATAEARFSYFPGVYLIGEDYMFGYALPNFFFHLVTTYDILRHHGFDIGKKDYMGNAVPFTPDAA